VHFMWWPFYFGATLHNCGDSTERLYHSVCNHQIADTALGRTVLSTSVLCWFSIEKSDLVCLHPEDLDAKHSELSSL